MLRVKNEAERAELYITGAIVDDTDGAALAAWELSDGYEWPADIKAQLDAMRGKPLTVYINSDGGSVPAGVAIANMIARHDAPTKAVVDGWCCSIATQIFFAANEREMPENAYLMIHKPWTAVRGDADELLKAAEFLDTLQRGIETTYNKAAREGVTAEQIHEMVEAETWLTGKDAANMFNISLTQAAPVLNCYDGAFWRASNRPDGLNVITEKTASPETEMPIFNADVDADAEAAAKEKQAARIKAALALAKGVIAV